VCRTDGYRDELAPDGSSRQGLSTVDNWALRNLRPKLLGPAHRRHQRSI